MSSHTGFSNCVWDKILMKRHKYVHKQEFNQVYIKQSEKYFLRNCQSLYSSVVNYQKDKQAHCGAESTFSAKNVQIKDS